MSRRFARAVLSPLAFVLLAALLPATARAIPDPFHSQTPNVIRLVGEKAGVPDPLGQFQIVVRDFGNNPVPNSAVEIRFDNMPEMSIGSMPHDSDLIVTQCDPYPAVRKYTNAAGVVSFTIAGAITNHSPGGFASGCTATVFADGVFIGQIKVTALDVDGYLGVSTNDVYLWLCDFGSGNDPCYVDYDGSSGVGSADLSILINALMGRRSLETPELCAASGGISQVADTLSGGLSMVVQDCTIGGSTSFDPVFCNTPTSRYTELVGKVNLSAAGVATSIANFTGVEATVRIIDFSKPYTAAISDFWRFDSPTGCHRLGFFDVAASTGNCLGNSNPLYASGSSGSGHLALWPHPGTLGALNAEELHLFTVATGPACGNSVPANGNSYPAFAVRINHNVTCSGCSENVAFVLESIQFSVLADPSEDCLNCGPQPGAESARPPLLGPGGAKTLYRWSPSVTDNVAVFSGGPSVGVEEETLARGEPWLSSPVPNPSTAGASLELALPREANVSADVYDVTGRFVSKLHDGSLGAGAHRIAWDGRAGAAAASDGVYFIRVEAAGRVLVRTVTVRR